MRRARHSQGLAVIAVCLFVLPAVAPLEGLGIFLLELVLLAGVYSISGERRVLVTAILLSAPALVARATGLVLDARAVLVAGNVMFVVAVGYVVSVYVKSLLTASEVDAEVISAAVSGYLLLGLLWTALYDAMFRLDAGSLRHTTGSVRDLGYFSFVTLATLGYGDIVPVTPMARAAAALEAVAGQLYMAITIARLVGLSIPAPRAKG